MTVHKFFRRTEKGGLLGVLQPRFEILQRELSRITFVSFCPRPLTPSIELVLGDVPRLDPGEALLVLPPEHRERLICALAFLPHPKRADFFTGASLLVSGTVTVFRPAVTCHCKQPSAVFA